MEARHGQAASRLWKPWAKILPAGPNWDQHEAVIRNDLGSYYLNSRQPEAALKEFERASDLMPGDPRVRKNLELARRLADRGRLWQQARQTGADLLWRAKKHLRLEVRQRFSDGSYLSRIYASESDGRKRRNGLRVRVVEYQLEGRRSRAMLSFGNNDPPSRARPGSGVSAVVSRTLGDRRRAGRAQDPSTRGADRVAQQDPGARAAGIPA